MAALRGNVHSIRRAVAVLLLAVWPAKADLGFSPIGPDGGAITRLLTDPAGTGTVFAGTPAGLWTYSPATSAWSLRNGTQLAPAVLSLAMDEGSRLYIGTAGTGLFVSDDGAASWKPVSIGLNNATINGIAAGPAAAAVYVTGTGAGGAGFGVLKSTDRGNTWTPVGTGLPSAPLGTIAVSPLPPYAVYTGSVSSGQAFVSIDGGSSWTEFAGFNQENVKAFSPSSLDAGKSYLIGDTSAYILQITPFHAPVIVQEILAGRGFGLIKALSQDGLSVRRRRAEALPALTPALYVCSEYGVSRTTDEGGSWHLINSGLTDLGILSLSADPFTGTLYAGTASAGVFRSLDAGDSWAPMSSGLNAMQVRSMAADASGGFLVLGGVTSIARSTNGGAAWERITAGLPNDDSLDAAVVDPSTPSTVFVGGQFSGSYRSTDGGQTFAKVGAGANAPCAPLAMAASAPSTLMARGCTGPEVVKSTDGGTTWAAAANGLPLDNASALVIDPTNPLTAYVGTYSNSISKTTDRGATWKPATGSATFLASERVSAIVIDPSSPSTVFIGTRKGVARTTDGGSSWASLNNGMIFDVVLGGGTAISALALDPHAPSTLYAATQASGVFRTTNGGASWSPLATGLTVPAVNALAVVGPAGTLLAGTSGGSVFKLGSLPPGPSTLFLPSTAHAQGNNQAFFTTDVFAANTGAAPLSFTMKFLGHDVDGTGAAEQAFSLDPGKTASFPDVLGSVFGVTNDFGGVRVTSSSPDLSLVSVTSTPGFGGAFGQTVPAVSPDSLVVVGAPRSILGVREDADYRTNLVLTNATTQPLGVRVELLSTFLGGSKTYTLPPLGTVQVGRVVRDLQVSGDVTAAELILSTTTAGGSFSAFASLIHNVTNDPTTLEPLPPPPPGPGPFVWFLPSTAHAPGNNQAFFTTNLTATNAGQPDAHFTLKFLGHDKDGTSGAEKTFLLTFGNFVSYSDILGSAFNVTNDFGAVRITSDVSGLGLVSTTSTPGANGIPGVFGQTVPAVAASAAIPAGVSRTILAVREDGVYRTNLVLCNASSVSVTVDVSLVAADGSTLGTKSYTLPPLGMTQDSRVVRRLGVSGAVAGARLILSTATQGGSFAAFTSLINEVTNDPTTVLPR